MSGEWTAHFVGLGLIGALIGLIVLFPHSEWTQALFTTYGVRGSGENGAMVRADHLRGAGLAFGVAALLLSLAIGTYIWADRYPGMSRVNWTLAAYGFAFTLLSGVSLLAACGALWRAIWWRPVMPASESEAPVDADDFPFPKENP